MNTMLEPPRGRRRHQHGGPERTRGPWLTPRRKAFLVVLWVVLLIAAAAYSASVGKRRAIALREGPRLRTTEAIVGPLRRTVALEGVVVREADQKVVSPATGIVQSVDVEPGDPVTAIAPLLTIELPLPPEPSPTPTFSPSPTPTPSVSPSPSPTPTPSPSPTPETIDVTSAVDGAISQVSVVEGQQITAGTLLLTISPDQFDVIGPVKQSLLDQFLAPPITISVKLPDTSAPFDCQFLSIGANLATSSAQVVLKQEADLRCQVPPEADVVPGIRVRVAAVTGQVEDAVLVPVTAIERQGDLDFVWVVQGRKTFIQQPVTLGISDGRLVEVLDGLFAGQVVLDPVEGQAPALSPVPTPSPTPTVSPSPTPTGSESPSPTPSST
jgi:multidrug efflux pump subunit AcrA (membrane-fusion protein)